LRLIIPSTEDEFKNVGQQIREQKRLHSILQYIFLSFNAKISPKHPLFTTEHFSSFML
jgi:hypothetical protein